MPASTSSLSRLANSGMAGSVNDTLPSSVGSSLNMTPGRSIMSQSAMVRRCHLAAKPVEEWDEEDVASWISLISPLPTDLAELLRCHAINGTVLVTLTEEDLPDLSLKFGHQRLLHLAAQELRAELQRQRRPVPLLHVPEEPSGERTTSRPNVGTTASAGLVSTMPAGSTDTRLAAPVTPLLGTRGAPAAHGVAAATMAAPEVVRTASGPLGFNPAASSPHPWVWVAPTANPPTTFVVRQASGATASSGPKQGRALPAAAQAQWPVPAASSAGQLQHVAAGQVQRNGPGLLPCSTSLRTLEVHPPAARGRPLVRGWPAGPEDEVRDAGRYGTQLMEPVSGFRSGAAAARSPEPVSPQQQPLTSRTCYVPHSEVSNRGQARPHSARSWSPCMKDPGFRREKTDPEKPSAGGPQAAGDGPRRGPGPSPAGVEPIARLPR